MDLTPKLIAAADMCAAGEDVNLDELAFLLRYSADELSKRPAAVEQRDRLMEGLRARLLARCDLLNRPESDVELARNGDLDSLTNLDERLDKELQQRSPVQPVIRENSEQPSHSNAAAEARKFQSGRQ